MKQDIITNWYFEGQGETDAGYWDWQYSLSINWKGIITIIK